MLFSINDTLGYRIHATDGEIGKVADLYFEDLSSRVRYVVVDTGGWLSSRKVLLAPPALGPLEPEERRIASPLTKEQIRSSPDVASDKPVSRQEEEALHRHYGWSPYWAGVTGYGLAPYWGGLGLAHTALPKHQNRLEQEIAEAEAARADPHLRSAREVIGYYVDAVDGEVGHVEDLLVEPDEWAIRFLVIDTRNWLPGRRVLVAPDWLRRVDWSEQKIVVDLTRHQIEAGPEYDPAMTVDRAYQEALYQHYARLPYWM